MIPRVEPEGMLFRKPLHTSHQVRCRLFPDHALSDRPSGQDKTPESMAFRGFIMSWVKDLDPSILPMDAGGKKVDRPTIAIKAGIYKVLVIEGDVCRGVQRPVVVGLEDILGPRIGQLSVSDK